jgi:response regulator RpfG family c-di-GMP phosphodiesterase
MPLAEILAELERCAGTQFDPTVVQAFIRIADRENFDPGHINHPLDLLAAS